MKRSQEVVAGGVLASAGLLFAVLLLEAGVRMMHFVPDRFWEPDPVIGVKLTPGASGWWSQEEREFVVPVAINSLGQRDVERSLENDAEVRRVLVLGDSFVEALQVELEESFVRRLEAHLNRRDDGRRVEVLNGGTSGWGTASSVLFYERDGHRYRPDLVLLAFYPGNDVRNNSPVLEDRFPPEYDASGRLVRVDGRSVSASPTGMEWKTYKFLRKVILTQQPELAEWLSTWGLIKTGAIRVAPMKDGVPVAYGGYEEPLAPDWQDAWGRTARLLDRLREAVEAHGADFVVAILSIREQVYPSIWEEIVAQHPAMQERGWDVDAPQRRIEAWCRERAVPCISLAPAFKRAAVDGGSVLHFRHDGHWTAAGHALAASELQKFIEGRQLLPQ